MTRRVSWRQPFPLTFSCPSPPALHSASHICIIICLYNFPYSDVPVMVWTVRHYRSSRKMPPCNGGDRAATLLKISLPTRFRLALPPLKRRSASLPSCRLYPPSYGDVSRTKSQETSVGGRLDIGGRRPFSAWGFEDGREPMD